MYAVSERRDPAVMRRVNDLIWESLEQGRQGFKIPFFCECALPGCYQSVWLTPAGYEEARADPAWSALAEGHRLAAAAG